MFHLTSGDDDRAAGLNQGREFRHLIRAYVDRYTHYHTGQFDERRAAAALDDEASRYRSVFPNLVRRIEGLAEGAQLPFLDVFAIQSRFFVRQARPQPEGCSQMVWPDSDRGPMLVGLIDADPGNYFVHQRADRSVYVCHAAFMHGGRGINRAGLAVGMSSCSAGMVLAEQYERLMVVAALAEACSTTGEAIDFLRRYPCQSNFTFADAAGRVALVQALGESVSVTETAPGESGLAVTNHYTDPDLQRRVCALRAIEAYPINNNTRCRLDWFEQVCHAYRGAYTFELAQSAVRSHHGFPHSVCNDLTVCATIATPDDRAFHVAEHPPCRRTFTRYALT